MHFVILFNFSIFFYRVLTYSFSYFFISAVRVAFFMSNGSARALSDNGSGVLSITCRFIKPNPCNMTSAALVVCG